MFDVRVIDHHFFCLRLHASRQLNKYIPRLFGAQDEIRECRLDLLIGWCVLRQRFLDVLQASRGVLGLRHHFADITRKSKEKRFQARGIKIHDDRISGHINEQPFSNFLQIVLQADVG